MNDNKRVYSIPVKLHVECRLFLLATSYSHAQQTAELVNLQDYFGFDPTHLTTDGERLLKIDDVVTYPIEVSAVDLTQLTLEEYDPRLHPDFIDIPRR